MRRHSLFVVILLVAAVVRVVILFISQTHVPSGEAIIGIMAKHILNGRYFPFYFYGVAYNASCAWEVYLALIPFAIFGVGVNRAQTPDCRAIARLPDDLLPIGHVALSFVYPFIFEPGEKIVVSKSIVGVDRPVYPLSIPKPEPSSQDSSVFVIESAPPYRAEIEAACGAKGGAAPRITEHGKLSIVEQRFASEL